MLDTKGPEIRTGILKENKPVELVAGQELQIVTDYAIEGDNTRIACSYKSLPETVSIGSTIFIADGSLTCEVTEIMEVSYHHLFWGVKKYTCPFLRFIVKEGACVTVTSYFGGYLSHY